MAAANRNAIKVHKEHVQNKIDEVNRRAYACGDNNVLDENLRALLKSIKELIELQSLKQDGKKKPQAKAESAKEKEQKANALFKEFDVWLKKNSVQSDSIALVGDLNEGNGLVASKDIKEGEKIIEIPPHLLITLKGAKEGNHSLKEFVNDNEMLKTVPALCLAIYLLYEKQALASFYAPYIRMLPKEYNLPINWEYEELKELQGLAQRETVKLIKNTIKQYAYLHTMRLEHKTFTPATFTLEAFLWAVSTVMSRQNEIPDGEKASQLALIPFWDMANHAEGKMTTFFEDGVVRCSAMQDFQKGEQIRIFYGRRPNRELLIYQGFVIPNNSSDVVTLVVNIDKSSTVFPEIKRLLGAESIEVVVAGGEEGKEMCLPLFRLLCMSEEEVKTIQDMEQLKEKSTQKLDDEREKKAVQMMQKLIQETLSLYPTTLKQDKDLLEKNMSQRKKLAVQARVYDKEILHSLLA
ncbi:histone-lysine N-methyltransferase setd3-like [Planoprotostelium fungivorum]|uniref:protein-histidine N-methyltransferase n=1 Tax=Planoprotostelium fungivorum TaxID=1890364 RepID=A0A2P6NRA9_9EUKA|nr:histone-lysine N-methyltransferase setd3-like [Planoprotostelium fungivorum]